MESWMLVPALILLVGIAVIIYGGLSDRAKAMARQAALTSPPPGTIPGLPADADAPSYVTAEQARTQSTAPPQAPVTTPTAEDAIGYGWARPGFATNAAQALLDQPHVLVTESVQTVRELLGPLQRAATTGQPLVLITGSLADSVAEMLEVNVIQRKFALVAVVIDDADARARLAQQTHATEIDRVDLQAGYIPDSSLGTCHRWISDAKHSWVINQQQGAQQ